MFTVITVQRQLSLPNDPCSIHAALALSQVPVWVVLIVPLTHQAAHSPRALCFRAAGCGAGWQIGPRVRNREVLVPTGHTPGHAVRHGFGQAPQGSHFLGLPAQHQLLLPLLRLQRPDLVLVRIYCGVLNFWVISCLNNTWILELGTFFHMTNLQKT